MFPEFLIIASAGLLYIGVGLWAGGVLAERWPWMDRITDRSPLAAWALPIFWLPAWIGRVLYLVYTPRS
jgi:ABC-type dipeptide/oligopeptide/nickel transport system permease component